MIHKYVYIIVINQCIIILKKIIFVQKIFINGFIKVYKKSCINPKLLGLETVLP